MAESTLSSLDRRFACEARSVLPDRYRWLLSLPKDGRYAARGAGVSYVAASFGPGSLSVDMRRFDRILAFDAAGGTIKVEAGITLGKLYDFLAPKGLYLPVQPGHPQITVGGCVAFDIHGKNQFREGLFDSCVEELELFHPAQGLRAVSRHWEPELFEVTCGGFGLTGIIVSATLKVRPIPGASVAVRNERVSSLRQTYERIEALKDSCDMLYSWNDLGPGGSGRGFITCGRFEDAPAGRVPAVQALAQGRPLPIFNRATLPLMNAAYRFLHGTLRPEGRVSFFAFNFPVVDKAFYFDWFGRGGFVERQMLVPSARRWEHLEAVERLLARHRPLVALATVKAFRGRPCLLRYDGEGISLSLDIVGGGEQAFHRELDELNAAMGVLDNPAKDSRLSGAMMEREYPGYEEFRERLRRHDPERLFRSEMSQRLGL